MLNELMVIFSYPFFIHAVVVGILVALCAALLGTSLVLRRYSMIGDGLSHVGFGALAIATALHAAPLAVTIPVVIAAAFFLLRASDRGSIRGDAAIAMISAGSLAVGIMVVSLTSGMNADINSFLFGSILSISSGDVVLACMLCAMVLLLFVLFYHKIFAITFDETFARATGVNVTVYNSFIAMLTAVTVVLGMKMVGALLISSLIIFPPLSAMRVCFRYRSVVLMAAGISAVCFLVGLVGSYYLSTPSGASVIVVNILAFFLLSAIGRLRTGTGR